MCSAFCFSVHVLLFCIFDLFNLLEKFLVFIKLATFATNIEKITMQMIKTIVDHEKRNIILF